MPAYYVVRFLADSKISDNVATLHRDYPDIAATLLDRDFAITSDPSCRRFSFLHVLPIREADLIGANLHGADLRGADLRRANLHGADLREANLLGANLRGADLTGANLIGADLRGANLRGADLIGANLREAYLRGADLRRANLREANLHGANLREAYLRGANLREAYLFGADLIGANLIGANIRGADLLGANLRGAHLQEANLQGANLEGMYDVPIIPNIHQAVAAACDVPGALNMSAWHTCSTTHCRAGWVVVLAGVAGKALEDKIGTNAAAALIYQASDPAMKRVPNWLASNEDALADIRSCATKVTT
jgi:uncharacterized protein YjbI with pentapeptide repeats